MFAGYFAENDYSYHSGRHLSQLVQISFTDSAIASKFRMSETKMKAIVDNVIGRAEKLRAILLVQKFSVLVDETTDVSTDK